MPHPHHEPAAAPRDFTIEEVERLGRALTPHIGAVMEAKLQPVRADIAALKKNASFWGAATGAMTSALIAFFGGVFGAGGGGGHK